MRVLFALLIVLILCGCSASGGTSASAETPSNGTAQQTLESEEPKKKLTMEEATRLANAEKEPLNITEEYFIQQCNDIYLNGARNVGRNVIIEGMFDEQIDKDTGDNVCYVFRYGPGCCGNDGFAGFRIVFDAEKPNVNDWIEVKGVVENDVTPDGFDNIYLKVTEMTVKTERGIETVAN